MGNDREILEELCVDDPWSSSLEGLDDCCTFCGSEDLTYHGTRGHTYRHKPDCVWIKAMDHLGRPHPEHTIAAKGPGTQ